jgi:hypothetical protein
MTTQASNKFKMEVMKGTVVAATDVFKIILMKSGFTYSPSSHGVYADVSSNELATAYGYTAGGATMSGISISQDDVNNQGTLEWSNTAWTVSGGDVTASGAIIYDDTPTSPADLIIGYIDFSGDQTVLNGGTFTLVDPFVKLT